MKKAGMVLFFFFLLISAGAQRVYSRMEASSESIRIGEQINIRLSFHSPNEVKNSAIEWPEFNGYFQDSLLEIISASGSLKKIKDQGENIIYRDYKVTCFEDAELKIKPVTIEMNGNSFSTNSLEISVLSVEVDTSAGPKDIKEIFSAEYTWKDRLMDIIARIAENWYYIVGGLILAAGFIFFLRRRRKPEEKEIILPPPHEEALLLLHELENEQLPEKGELKIFYSRITSIIRNFLERRFEFNAPELTSHEIIRHLKGIKCTSESISLAREIFSISDLVKFAKGSSTAEESLRALELSRKFIHSIPELVPEEKEEIL